MQMIWKDNLYTERSGRDGSAYTVSADVNGDTRVV